MANPSKSDIETIFSRLRSQPANKVCFDCNAKNPTWSSVTYGVFICIDCSAVHRSLGVHLTFVRSTQLDTNWTWIQLRQMQLGGNANAKQFFAQHNCVTTDAQLKYNSRAAQLYREKLQNLAHGAMKTLGTQLHLHPVVDHDDETHAKDVDFFSEHEKNINFEETYTPAAPEALLTTVEKKDFNAKNEVMGEPNVTLTSQPNAVNHKSTIGVRKLQPKKSSLGAKKGLGATRVKTNFAEIEREAELIDESKRKAQVDAEKQASLTVEEKDKQLVSMRLAYQDLSLQHKKEEDKLKQVDPKKAEQVERLGMGFASKSGISHSALTGLKTIEQSGAQKSQQSISKLISISKDNDSFFDDDYSFGSKILSSKYDDDESSAAGYFDPVIDFYIAENPNHSAKSSTSTKITSSPTVTRKPIAEKVTSQQPSYVNEDAQKKFGNAKAISSDQYFNKSSSDHEAKANLTRFEGSSSISSADYFGHGDSTRGGGVGNSYAQNFQTPDLEDVKESVKQGVTKVAGKLSSLANGVMSSIQDRYGY